MRRDAKQSEVAMDGVLGGLCFVREGLSTPVGRADWSLVERLLHELGDVVILVSTPAMAWRQIVESTDAVGDIPSTPICNGRIGDLKLGCDHTIGHAVSDHEDDLGAPRQGVRQAARARKALQLSALFITQSNGIGFGSTDMHRQAARRQSSRSDPQ